MASTIIHMCVANEVNKKIKVKNYNEFLLGAIAPDLSKLIGYKRDESHFIDHNISSFPCIEKFLKKYGDKLDSDFLLGYFVHLYTDYLWYKYFMKDIYNKNLISSKDGTKLKYDKQTFRKFVYNDYTNLNVKLIDAYNLDLSLFYNPLVLPNLFMDEIPINRLQVLLDNASVIIENSKTTKSYFFDVDEVLKFISDSAYLIYKKILNCA